MFEDDLIGKFARAPNLRIERDQLLQHVCEASAVHKR